MALRDAPDGEPAPRKRVARAQRSGRGRRAVAAVAPAFVLPGLALAGCSLALGFDQLVFDRGAGGGAASGAGGAGATTSSGGAAGHAAGGGGSGAGAGGQGGSQPGGPILQTEGSIGAGHVIVHADPRFRLDFDENNNWQAMGWFDLTAAPADDLSAHVPGQATDILFNTYVEQSAQWYDIEGGTTFEATLYESWQARAVHHTVVDYALTGLRSTVEYTIYPSGRIGTKTVLENTGATPIALGDVEFGYTAVQDAHAWTVTSIANGKAALFERTDASLGTPTLVVINHDNGIMGQDSAFDRYWANGPVSIGVGSSIERDVELQVWPSSQTSDVLDRVNDALNPALTNLSGLTDVGYNYGAATYYIDVAGSPSSVTFAPTNAHTRYYPAFFIGNWQSNSWSVWLDGQKLCSSTDNVGTQAIAGYLNGYALVVAHQRVIPSTATLAERTFTVQTTP